MFSQTIEYALRAVLALATSDGAPLTTRQIAAAMNVPASYLSKVLQSLVRAKLVHSTRGLKGGFVLIVPAEELTLLRVLEAAGPLQRIETCPLDLEPHSSGLCPLHRRLDEAMSQVQKAFATTTVADLLSEENRCPTLRSQLQSLQALPGAKS